MESGVLKDRNEGKRQSSLLKDLWGGLVFFFFPKLKSSLQHRPKSSCISQLRTCSGW